MAAFDHSSPITDILLTPLNSLSAHQQQSRQAVVARPHVGHPLGRSPFRKADLAMTSRKGAEVEMI